jgi:hypothetical protein
VLIIDETQLLEEMFENFEGQENKFFSANLKRLMAYRLERLARGDSFQSIKRTENDTKHDRNDFLRYSGRRVSPDPICSLCKIPLTKKTFKSLFKQDQKYVASFSNTTLLAHRDCFKKFYLLKKSKQLRWKKFRRSLIPHY